MDEKPKRESIHAGHRQRMKGKFLKHGIKTFEDHEILEMLLYYCIPQINTNPIAHALLNKFGSIDRVFDAPYKELLTVSGIGESTATLIKFIPQLSRRYNEARITADNRIFDEDKIIELIKAKFIGAQNEEIVLLLLGSDSSLLYCDVVTEGAVSTVPVYIKLITNLAIEYNADTAIIAHNHPSGNALPSPKDISATREVMFALDGIGVFLDDHVIVAKNDYSSLKNCGWLYKLRNETNLRNEVSPSEVDFLISTKKEELDKRKARAGAYAADKKTRKKRTK